LKIKFAIVEFEAFSRAAKNAWFGAAILTEIEINLNMWCFIEFISKLT
jgi:hypothetical protein